ncbi:MspA family porin [Mycobacterium montefiorense]|uniref:MspA family porin n=1 Tax=Mycobacterium montefiorense TaxID=154654 RepID=UPI001F296B3F|nr:MspA family porin [Mycobacterium montefiorense]
MVLRRAGVFAVCVAMSVIMAPTAGGDPDTESVAAAAAPAGGPVASNPPATITTPDGWSLGLGAKDEAQVPVSPLTTAISSREYLSSGVFVGSLRGPEQAQGILEVGYEIGCGIDMSTSNGVEVGGNAGLTPSLGFTGAFPIPGTLLPVISAPMGGSINVGLKPGFVIVVPVVKKQFRGANPWVMISNFHVKIDGCVGQSFIRSYATLTRVTDLSDVVLSYVGVTTAV